MQTEFLTNESVEIFDSNSIKLPYILKDKVLMAPGIWNDTYYDSEAIINGFKNTDWKDKDIRALFYDHEDRKAQDWIGYVENPRLINDKVLGDLHIYNKEAAIQLGIAKMKCGISPKVKGNEDKDKKMSEMSFLNFSIVTNPACKTAYINLSQKDIIVTNSTDKKVDSNINNQTIEKEVKKMENMAVISDQPVEVIEELKKKPVEEEKAPKNACMSDAEFADLITLMSAEELSEYSDFVSSFMKKNKGVSVKDAAKAFKDQKEMQEKFAKLSEDELIEQINVLTSILRRNKCYSPLEEKEKKMSEEINSLTSKVKELEVKLNTPEQKTVKALSEITPVVQTQTMWDFLKVNAKI